MMKYLALTLYLLILTLQCGAQTKTKMNTDLTPPQVTPEMETFDINAFEQCKEPGSSQHVIENDEYYQQQLSQSFGYGTHTFYSGAYFSVMKLYFHNGKVWQKGVMFSNSEIGTWYEFNEQGELIAEINTDEGYAFSWMDIIEYCTAHEIVLTKGYVRGGYQTKLFKVTENGKKAWKIDYQSDHDKITHVILDAETGEEIRRETMKYINN